LTAVFDSLPPESPALPRNIFALVRKLFSWAEERGDIDRSPMTLMKSPKAVASRDRVLTREELRWVLVLAGELGPPFGQFVRMLIVTGQRRDEVAGMTWNELDREAALWTLPKARTKNNETHKVPLNKIAMRELNMLADGENWPRKGLVFTTTGVTPVSGYSRMKTRLDSWVTRANQGEPIQPWRLHDLRRTFATNMQPLGVRFEVTEALLNHVSGSKAGVAGVYQRHDWSAEKAAAVELWADWLIQLLPPPARGTAKEPKA
jgi:integrase